MKLFMKNICFQNEAALNYKFVPSPMARVGGQLLENVEISKEWSRQEGGRLKIFINLINSLYLWIYLSMIYSRIFITGSSYIVGQW